MWMLDLPRLIAEEVSVFDDTCDTRILKHAGKARF
jgi:hypothetical protein